MAKKVSMKTQILQSIANSQVQQALNQQREQQNAQLMADFDNFMKQQQNPEALMADFNSWKQQNAAPQPRQSIPSIADTQPKRDLQAEAREYFANVRKERAAEEAEAKRVKEQQLKATINDYARQQQEENMLVSNSASKKKELKIGKRPEATDFSSQVAARPVDRETLKGGKKWNESVNNTLNMLNNTRPMPVMGNDLVENEPIIPENYTRPETQEDMVNRWLSPDTKLTDDEKKAAKEYASAELQKVQYGPNKQPLLNTPEERQHYADMVNLINKTNGFTNFMSGAIEVPYNLADMVSDGARSVGNQLGGLGAAITDKLGITEGATKRHNEQAEIANQFADQNEANMRQSFKNAQTQNPGAYTVGKIAGQTGMYMLTNPVFDGIAAGAGVESELAKFFINQGAQNVQDLVLDTAPTVRQLMEDGSTPEEVKREALSNILWNVIGNAVMGGLGAWAGNRAARKASDEAFRENVRAGADNLSRVANEIPGIEDVDNVVRNATRQTEEAAQNIDNIAKQQNDGIRVYRGFNRSDNPLEKNLAGEKSVYDALGKNDPNAPNMLPLNFYTESIDDAAQYANADKAFYESLGEIARRDAVARATENGINFNELSEANRNALIKQYQDEAYRNLTGRNPNFSGSHVDEIAINPKKVLDISDLDEKVSVDDMYNRLSELTGVDKNTIDNRLMLSNVADENGMVSQYQVLRNTGQTAGDFTGTRFVDFMLDHGYDAIKHKESGVNHYVTLNNAADTLKIPQFLSDATIENDILPYANALAEQVQSIGASRRFEKAYEDLWDYIYARRNELEPKWRDLSKIESELRSSAPDGVDVDSFINRINEVINPYKERKITDIASNVVSSKNAARGELSIQEANRKGGKKGYYVAESVGDGASKNVEPGKIYKSREEAEKAMDQYRTMAESISKPKSEIITSEPIEPGKYEIPDTPENAPTTDDLWDELSGNKAPETPITAKTQEIDDKGRKLSKLHATLQNTDKLTDAEKKAFADKNGFWYDPDNEKLLASNTQREIEDIGLDAMYDRYMGGDMSGKTLSGQDTHNMFTTSFDYNKMAQEALQNGDEDLARLYEAKARNIMLEARETATDYGKFNAAIAYYSRTPQGYIDKAYEQMSKQISDFKGNNPKLANDIDRFAKQFADDLKDTDVDAIMSGTDEAAKQSLRQKVYDSLEKMLKDASPQAKQKFSNLSDAELDDIIVSKYEKDLARTLDMFAMGSYGVKPETVDKVLDLFADAEKYDINSKQYYNIEKQAFDLLANDLMSGEGKTFAEKFDTWRYFAMLMNPLTHLKNITGNFNNKLLVGVKNNLAAAIEEGAEKAAKAKGRAGIQGGRTKAFIDPTKDGELLSNAGKYFDEKAFREFKQGGNKWIDVGRELANAGDAFNSKNVVGRGLNKVTSGNSNVLDMEDIIAGKATFETSMAGFLKANGADASIFTKTDDASKRLLEEAKAYALQQANEATFHQKNELAQAISQFIKEGRKSESTARRIFSGALDFMVPFIKTPANILRACFEYSPLEFIRVAKETKAWKNGAVSTAKYIDDISKGLTGTAGLGIGALLSAAGILKVSSGDDVEDSFNKKRGLTTPSIKIGNASFKISELAPAAMPIIVGGTIFETIRNGKKSAEAAADTIFNGLSVIGDTVTDMTMLSGIAGTLNDIRYARNNPEMWGQLGLGVINNAAGQVLPTLGRKIEQTIDDTARSSYSASNSALIRSIDSNAKYLKTKLPMLQEIGEGLEKSSNQHIANIGDFLTNEPQIDAWGNEVKNPDYNLSNIHKGLGYIGRGLHNTVDVFDTRLNSSNKLDNELRNLAESIPDEETRQKVLLYGLPASSTDATVNGQRMSEKQWTAYQKDFGAMKSKLLQNLMDSESYSDMSVADKTAVLDTMKDFAKNYNQNKIMDKELDSFNSKLAEAYNKGDVDGVIKKIRDKQTANAAGYQYKEGSELANAIDDMSEEEKEEFKETSKQLTDYGLSSYGAQETWNKVQSTYQSKHKPIPSMEDFVNTFKDIDENGKGSISQDELINYFNENKYTQSNADLYWEAYGSSGWKYIPVLENNKWHKKKK